MVQLAERLAAVRRTFPLVLDLGAHHGPIGRRIRLQWEFQNSPAEIVGVVGDVRHNGLTSEPEPTVFVSHAQAPSYIGLLTALYGIGQIVGPPLAAGILGRSATQAAGFTLSLEVAAAALLIGAGMYAAMVRIFPLPPNKT